MIAIWVGVEIGESFWMFWAHLVERSQNSAQSTSLKPLQAVSVWGRSEFRAQQFFSYSISKAHEETKAQFNVERSFLAKTAHKKNEFLEIAQLHGSSTKKKTFSSVDYVIMYRNGMERAQNSILIPFRTHPQNYSLVLSSKWCALFGDSLSRKKLPSSPHHEEEKFVFILSK